MLRYSVVFTIGCLLLCFGVILGMLIALSNGQRELGEIARSSNNAAYAATTTPPPPYEPPKIIGYVITQEPNPFIASFDVSQEEQCKKDAEEKQKQDPSHIYHCGPRYEIVGVAVGGGGGGGVAGEGYATTAPVSPVNTKPQ
jgi:hypothetical protein